MRPARLRRSNCFRPRAVRYTARLVMLAASALAAPAQSQSSAGNPLAFLEPLLGEWAPVVADSVLRERPQLRDRIVHAYEWTVGRNAIRVREGYPRGKPDQSVLDGLIFWDPSTQQVLFVAVAGHGEGEGRLFHGEYTRLADGRIERVYDVLYRTLADTPGEEFGGTRRRYREVYTVNAGSPATATLDWWLNGRWAPYGPGQYSFKRVAP